MYICATERPETKLFQAKRRKKKIEIKRDLIWSAICTERRLMCVLLPHSCVHQMWRRWRMNDERWRYTRHSETVNSQYTISRPNFTNTHACMWYNYNVNENVNKLRRAVTFANTCVRLAVNAATISVCIRAYEVICIFYLCRLTLYIWLLLAIVRGSNVECRSGQSGEQRGQSTS